MVKLLPGNRNTCFHAENNEVEINPWKIKFLTHLYCQKRSMRVLQHLPPKTYYSTSKLSFNYYGNQT